MENFLEGSVNEELKDLQGALLVLCAPCNDDADYDNDVAWTFTKGSNVITCNGDLDYGGGTDVVVGDQLTLFCTDGGNNRVQTYRVIDSQLQLFSPHHPLQTDTNWLDQPTGISRSPAGEIYVVDQGHHRWLKFDTSGRILFQCGRYGDGINQFNQPTDVATDRDGNLYIVDSGNGRIKKYDFSGNFIMQWSENLHYPNRIAAYDFIYVTDKQSVKVFTPTGTYVTEIGPFDQPAGVATFEDRYLYVTDLLRNTISVFDLKSVISNQ